MIEELFKGGKISLRMNPRATPEVKSFLVCSKDGTELLGGCQKGNTPGQFRRAFHFFDGHFLKGF